MVRTGQLGQDNWDITPEQRTLDTRKRQPESETTVAVAGHICVCDHVSIFFRVHVQVLVRDFVYVPVRPRVPLYVHLHFHIYIHDVQVHV
jgi:hypothetical protein